LGDLPRDPRDFLPLKDLVFRILVALAEGEQHGWSLVQSLDEPSPAPLAVKLPSGIRSSGCAFALVWIHHM
jgi:hypothetical protein